MNTIAFNMMSFWFKIRDLMSPPDTILSEVGIKPGFSILDYGCGPGSYTIAAAKRVGSEGKVNAVDITPAAIRRVEKTAENEGLNNVETILSSCKTDVKSASIDVVLLYDVFHALDDANAILKELHRVLKPSGVLSFSDHHMKEHDILEQMQVGELFVFSSKGKKTYTFLKEGG